MALHRAGKLPEALKAYRAGLAEEPNNSDALHLAGVIAFQQGQIGDAVDLFERAATPAVTNFEVWVNLGSALWRIGRPADGLKALTRALELNPASPEALVLAGHCHQALGEVAAARDSFAKALALRPGWGEALEAIAYALRDLGQFDAALERAQEAVHHEPRRVGAIRLIGLLLMRASNTAEAERQFRLALQIDPNDRASRELLGAMLDRTGRTEGAIEQLRAAVDLQPEDAISRYSLATALLKSGQLAEGWGLYAARHRRDVGFLAQRMFMAPRLSGNIVPGQHLLAWTDQGIGEEIMFANLIPDILAQKVKLTVECEPRLVALFARSFPGVEFFPRTDPTHPRFRGPFAAHVALADTARQFRRDFKSFPKHAGYLRPDADRTARMRTAYRQNGQTVIGLAWRTSANAKTNAAKSVPLAEWAPLLKLPDVTWVNLQYGDCAEEIAAAEATFGVRIISDPAVDPLKDLDAFAAQVAAMDAVVSISNATAHMAGALDIPTWTVVRSGPGALWHWFDKRDDSPWYPRMRLIRAQAEGGNVLADLAAQLAAHVAHSSVGA